MKIIKKQDGVIIIGAFVVTFLFLIISLSVAEFGVTHYTSARRTLVTSSALNGAEAGADSFMYQINQNSGHTGTTNAPSGTSDSCTGYTITPHT